MSLVGTRPPTVDEWEQYELHHRSRMSTKPGITGMPCRTDVILHCLMNLWSRLIGSSIKDSDTAGYNSVLSSRADIGKDCYLEVSYVHGEAKVGEHCVLS